jgi:diguanylate cyclase (GGDEF)-like protein
MKTCRREFSRAARAGQCISVLSIDIDHFKKYNYGHDAGNMVFVRWQLPGKSVPQRGHSVPVWRRGFVVIMPGATPGPGRLDRDPGVHCDYPRHETARAA